MTKVKTCAGKDNFQRMNYLYQVSYILANENRNNNLLSVMYSNLLVNISKKCVQRLDIDIKRMICKGCRALLIAGVSCQIRLKKKTIYYACSVCNTRKRFRIDRKDHVPWTLTSEAVVETLHYNESNIDDPKTITY